MGELPQFGGLLLLAFESDWLPVVVV